MQKIAFKKWISLNTAVIFMFQQIFPAFAMDPLEHTSPSTKPRKMANQKVTTIETTLTNNKSQAIVDKVANNKSLSPEEEKNFKLISEEVVKDLLHIKHTFSVQAKGDLVIVIGQTGSGKTALTEWLGGEKTLKIEKGTFGTFFTSETGHIQNGRISGTTSPIVYQIDNNIYCADTPGFNDTRGVLQTTTNAVYMRELLRNNPSVKFIVAELVSELTSHNGRGLEFKNALCFLKNMFTDTFFTKNLPLQDSLSLVLTHYDNTSQRTKLPILQEWITKLVEGTEGIITNILASFSQENKIAFFSEPLEATDYFQNEEEKQIILNNINATKSLTFSFDEDIQSSFSLESQLLLKKIHEDLKTDFISLLHEMVEKELLPCVYNKLIQFKEEVDKELRELYTFFGLDIHFGRSMGLLKLIDDPLNKVFDSLTARWDDSSSAISIMQLAAANSLAVGGFLALNAFTPMGIGAPVVMSATILAATFVGDTKRGLKAKSQQICDKLKNLSTGLTNAQNILCSNGLLGEEGALKQFKPNLTLSKLQETATSLEYLSALLNKDAAVSQTIWTSVFEDFEKQLTQYANQSAEDLYNTAEELFKKKERAQEILIKQVQEKQNLRHISESFIETVVSNLEKAGSDEDINVTGSPLSQEEKDQLLTYMDLCSHIYTDDSTRAIIKDAGLSIKKKWNEIIGHKKWILEFQEQLSAIFKQEKGLDKQDTLYIQEATKNTPSAQVPALPTAPQRQELENRYINCVSKINVFFQNIGKQPIISNRLSELSSSIEALRTIYADIQHNYNLYFSEIPFAEPFNCSYQYLDTESHHLTNQGIVASAFLNKSKLVGNPNITILKVGFRNLQDLSGIYENVMAKVVSVKNNPISWFENWGEVDYIAYLENDPTESAKDKLVIVYSGSNSQKDWVKNFTLGHQKCVNLSAHEGITKLFNASSSGHTVLVDDIDHYYKAHRKPQKFSIITTGHSLGGALASLALYCHKSNSVDRLKKITSLEKISFKTFLFGSPAIFDKPSKEIYEKQIGLKNIFRVWNANDIVVTLTDKAIWQGGEHIGTSYPLYNINNVTINMSDRIWGPHALDSYQCHLQDLQQNNPNHQLFTAILKDYVQDPYTYEERQNQKDKK